MICVFLKLLQNVIADVDMDMLNETNKYRKEQNLDVLKFNEKLQNVAQEQVDYMCLVNKLTHSGRKNTDLSTRLEKKGIDTKKSGENIAKSTTNDYKAIVKLWKKSKPHNMNIIGDFTDTAVAHCRTSVGHNNIFWIQVFAKLEDKQSEDTHKQDEDTSNGSKQQRTKLIFYMKNDGKDIEKEKSADQEDKYISENLDSILQEYNSILPSERNKNSGNEDDLENSKVPSLYDENPSYRNEFKKMKTAIISRLNSLEKNIIHEIKKSTGSLLEDKKNRNSDDKNEIENNSNSKHAGRKNSDILSTKPNEFDGSQLINPEKNIDTIVEKSIDKYLSRLTRNNVLEDDLIEIDEAI